MLGIIFKYVSKNKINKMMFIEMRKKMSMCLFYFEFDRLYAYTFVFHALNHCLNA